MSISKSYFFPHSVEELYSAWTSSDTVIPPATAMDIDVRVGGHYRLIIESDEFSTIAEGKFSILEPNQRLVYSWQWSGSEEVTTIDVSFLKELDGCRIQLEHTGFITKESHDNHDTGWDSYFDGLTRFLS